MSTRKINDPAEYKRQADKLAAAQQAKFEADHAIYDAGVAMNIARYGRKPVDPDAPVYRITHAEIIDAAHNILSEGGKGNHITARQSLITIAERDPELDHTAWATKVANYPCFEFPELLKRVEFGSHIISSGGNAPVDFKPTTLSSGSTLGNKLGNISNAVLHTHHIMGITQLNHKVAEMQETIDRLQEESETFKIIHKANAQILNDKGVADWELQAQALFTAGMNKTNVAKSLDMERTKVTKYLNSLNKPKV